MTSLSLSSQRLRLVLGLVALDLVLIAVGWLLLVSPQRHHASTASHQASQLQGELGVLDRLHTATSTTVTQPKIATKDLYRLAQAMPATADVPGLLLGLDQLAAASGVKVVSLSPQSPTAASGYSVLPISLSVSGGYGSITRFLHRLRTLVSLRHGQVVASGRLFSVTSVALSPGNGKVLTATLALQTYTFGGSGSASASGSTDTTSTDTTTGQ